jgi:DNA mismatch repair protein MutS2
VSLFASIPEPVEELSAATLEWARLLELVQSYASASVTRAWVRALLPSAEAEWIRAQHALADEARVLLSLGVSPALGGLIDPDLLLAKARIGGAMLEPDELRALLALVDDIGAWQEKLAEPPEDAAERVPLLLASASVLEGSGLPQLVRSLRGKLNPDGTLTDDASPDLRRIRREIERQQKQIEDSLRHALRRLSADGSTQDELITIRGERFVIPVKAEMKRRVTGVVHGASSSGQTVYLEPLETIEHNNELVRLLDEEQSEIQRIYRAMTAELAAQGPAIRDGARVLAELDWAFTAARFGQAFKCVRPEFAAEDSPELLLEQARHPLLERRLRDRGGSVVPMTLRLANDARQLIISGPNTGGKTVALKTTGLLAMMAQAGIPVPAERAVLPIFDAFLADIGDAQSIEQNLSTFSAHIVNLDRISRVADDGSLVLLDELGSATDPEEGAALAVAIAEHFLARRCWSIISTHHTSLKIYAAQATGVLNAAVGFNEATLAPTYELRLGVPGASAGINIASRLGLNEEIIGAARTRLHTQTQDIAKFLDQLHSELDAVVGERASLKAREQEVAREKNRLDSEGLKEWRAKVRELEGQLASLLKDFEYRMKQAVLAIDDRAVQQKLSKEAERRMAKLRRDFGDELKSAVVAQHTGAHKGDVHATPHIVRGVGQGDTVRLKSLGGKTAVVQRELDGGGYEVAMGLMKMRVSREDIAEIVHSVQLPSGVHNPLEAARKRGVSVTVTTPSDGMRGELNVIGRTVDEASDEVEQFLDRAFLAGYPRVRIVHGTGMGILRRALRAQLQKHPHVATVTEATQAEGGAGATVVELRQ